jgi:hypothetical protein
MSANPEPPERKRLLGRLLGPDAPEMSCDECFERLDRYVELSLAGKPADEQVPGMRAHLEGCPACAEDFESLRELVSDQG